MGSAAGNAMGQLRDVSSNLATQPTDGMGLIRNGGWYENILISF